jgi:hypothetical protein
VKRNKQVIGGAEVRLQPRDMLHFVVLASVVFLNVLVLEFSKLSRIHRRRRQCSACRSGYGTIRKHEPIRIRTCDNTVP